ncbi:transposase [Sphaerimonospora cavernae]|uniref:Transposase n=1 Tax=Sphaerimonospora cavernae TaxID=1740611 RepID=A0ABV6U7J7_9ACTN
MCFADESGQSLRPLRGRTWARRGQTPIVCVTGKGSGRVSLAGLVCVKPGQRSRLIYRAVAYHGRKGEKKGIGITDLQSLLRSAHHLLGGPIVLVWDNLNAHVGPTMRTFIDAHDDWLTVFRLPAYAPELNPVERSMGQFEGQADQPGPTQCPFTGPRDLRRCLGLIGTA